MMNPYDPYDPYYDPNNPDPYANVPGAEYPPPPTDKPVLPPQGAVDGTNEGDPNAVPKSPPIAPPPIDPGPGPDPYQPPPNAGPSAAAGPAASSFAWPTFTAPVYQSPGPFKPKAPEFAFDAFAAPTAEQARQSPGYQFAADEGRKQVENSAAGRGVLRSGGTLKNILEYGNKFADQNYDNVFNRELTGYKTNRDNAFGNWASNYGVEKDVYDRTAQDLDRSNTYNFNSKLAEFNPTFDAAKMNFSDAYNRWRDQLNSLTSIASAGAAG